MKLVRVRGFASLKTGDRFRCMIRGRDAPDGIVYKAAHARLFLCQDIADGTTCERRHRGGFRYGWILDPYNRESFKACLRRNGVTGLRKKVKGET